MEPRYCYRWTHMREYMGLTPMYRDYDLPDVDLPAPGDRVIDRFVSWLTLTGCGGLLFYALTVLVP